MNLRWSIAVLVVADAVAIGAMLLVRKRAPDGGFFADGDRASGVSGVLATGFAILVTTRGLFPATPRARRVAEPVLPPVHDMA